MIYGIGTDIVYIARLAALYAKHGERALEKILAPNERDACRASRSPERFLAKRFAAKEALGKALGVGVRSPVVLPAIEISHDVLGKPIFAYSAALASYLAERALFAHLSLSDEQDQVVAFVIVEQG